ncbi:hypothetical protein PUN28_020891 [Cardiocondyla obscurior]|uniref:Uncharacterized protein n=1 Tax=Cardiocondyla obscurior TaxID=286306 RepID=A0AAW2E884_9HYME
MAKNKKMFLNFYCATIKNNAYEPIPSLLFSPEAEIWRCIRAYSEPSIFTSSRDMLFIFIRSRDMAKNEKIFLKFCNVALCATKNRSLCATKNRCIRDYSELCIFTSSRDMAKNEKNIFEILKRSIVRCIRTYSKPSIFTSSRDMAKNKKNKPRYGQKRKNKFCNVALCATKNRCIRDYSELSIFTRSRDMAKNDKNIFETLQRSIVQQLKIMHTSLFRAFYFHQKPRYGQKTK